MLTNKFNNNHYMKEVEQLHPELSHLSDKDLLTWDEYSLFLTISLPIVRLA